MTPSRPLPAYRAELVRAQSDAYKRLCRSGARAIVRADAKLNRLRADLARALVNCPLLQAKVDAICERAREDLCDEIMRTALAYSPGALEKRTSP